jgi:signal transduction histidine kinase
VSSNLELPAPAPGLARAQSARFSASVIGQLARGLLRHSWWVLTLLCLLILLSGRSGPSLAEFKVISVTRSACDGSQASEASLPLYDRGRDCMRILASRHLSADQTIEQSLLVSGVGRDARIWINGNLLREFDARASFDSTSQPLLVPLQPGILHPGDNELLFQIRSGDGRFDRSFLGSVLLGPSESLAPAFERIRALSVSGAQLAIVVGVAILLTLLPMALLRLGEREHRWFAISVLCSLVYIWNMGWPLRPLPAQLWQIMAHAALGLALWSMLRFSFIQVGPSPVLRAWVDRIIVISLTALPFKAIGDSWWLSAIGDTIYRSGLIVLLVVLAVYWWQRRSRIPIARWLAAAAVLNIVLGVADSLRVWNSPKGEIAPYLVHWGILYLLVLLLIGQIKRILEALHTAEHAQQQLAEALEQRSRELQHEFSLRQQAEQARTLAEERQRIMRDMHDGVGGQLVALIGQADHGTLDEHKLKRQLRRSLDDLRLMIDSLDDACADLGVALGMLRQRLQSSLKDLPIVVHWQTAQLPDLAPRAPDEVLQVLRIVQESITNALKHAQCRQLDISASWNQGWLEICVQDDGIGLSETAARGRGLPGMRQRAARIGATIDIANHPPGTRVCLRMPQALV